MQNLRELIKKLWNKFKENLIVFGKWLKEECKDWHTFLILFIVSAILFTPVWGGYLLFFMFHWEWAFWLASSAIALLIGPIPFWVTSIAITLGIKRLFEKKQEHDKEQESNADKAAQPEDINTTEVSDK